MYRAEVGRKYDSQDLVTRHRGSLHNTGRPNLQETKVFPAICTRSMIVYPPSSRGSLLTVKRWLGERRISLSCRKNEYLRPDRHTMCKTMDLSIRRRRMRGSCTIDEKRTR